MYRPLTSNMRYSGGAPIPFENQALLNAVRKISNNIVRRSYLNTRDRRYAGLLSDILGQSHYATIEILARKRRQSAENLARKRREHSTSDSLPLSTSDVDEISYQQETQDPADQFSSVMRDELVKLLYATKMDEASTRERSLTLRILQKDGPSDVESLRRLWGIPKVVFEATKLDRYFLEVDEETILLFYDRRIWKASNDTRIFNILYWKESCFDRHHDVRNDLCFPSKRRYYHSPRRAPDESHAFRTVSKSVIAKVVKVLLSKRRKPLFEQNMDVVIETVMYTINPDRFIERFRETALRDAGFFKGLHGFEYSRSFTGSLENLQMGKFNRMVKDIRSLRGHESAGVRHNHGHGQSNYVSLRAIRRYCNERDLLTDRALRRVYERYVRNRSRRQHHNHSNSNSNHKGLNLNHSCQVNRLSPPNSNYTPSNNSNSRHKASSHQRQMQHQFDEMRFSIGDFVRMYLAWVGCSTDAGVKYWFFVLDQDGDGVIGLKDVVHFYSERKVESERRSGMYLADVKCLWTRLCAMSGNAPNGPGMDLQAFLEMGVDEREFVIFALLPRRADDGQLVDLNLTMKMEAHLEGSEGGSAIMI